MKTALTILTFCVSIYCLAQGPTPELTTTAPSQTYDSPIPIQIDFGEAVTGFDETDFNLVNGTIDDFVYYDDFVLAEIFDNTGIEGQYIRMVKKGGKLFATKWVGDTEYSVVVIDAKTGVLITEMGSIGSGDGQLSAPSGIGVSSFGEIYVADYYNSRIAVFSEDGSWLRNISNLGTDEGQLNYPTMLTFDTDGNLYVAGYFGEYNIQVFDADDNFLYTIEDLPASDIQVVGDSLWVLSYPNNISVYHKDGTFKRSFTIDESNPALEDIYVSDEYVFAAVRNTDRNTDQVQVVDHQGNAIKTISLPYAGTLTADPNNLYVRRIETQSIYVYNSAINYYSANVYPTDFGMVTIQVPAGVALDADDNPNLASNTLEVDYVSEFNAFNTKFLVLSGDGQTGIFLVKPDGSSSSKWLTTEQAGTSNFTHLPARIGDTFIGVTGGGGQSNPSGMIYRMKAYGEEFEVVHSFASNTGTHPSGPLTEYNGKLWGVTGQGGGTDAAGVIYTVDTDGSNYTVVHTFMRINNAYPYGNSPQGQLYIAEDKIWGLTSFGGANNKGIIFTINANGTGFTVVHEFATEDGSSPNYGLVEFDGKLWGTTSFGGTTGNGTVFTLNPDGTNFTVMHDFQDATGRYPSGKLVESNGKLWGVFYRHGEISGLGGIFSIDAEGIYTAHHFFTGEDGKYPRSTLVSHDNKLYGVTVEGGELNKGVLFSIDNDGSNFIKVSDLNPNVNGGASYGLMLVPVKDQATLEFSLTNKTYGDDPFTLGATTNAISEVSFTSSNSNIVSVSGNTATIKGAGEVTITANHEEDAYFGATSTSKMLTVSKATLTVTANDETITYGDEEPVYAYQYSGFVYNEDESVIDTPPTGVQPITNVSDAGEYTIAISEDGEDDNYEFSYMDGILTVEKAQLTVTPDNHSRAYGEPNPTLTFGYAGFVNEEDASVIDQEPTASTTATSSSNVGEYTITLDNGSDNNYDFTYETGTLVIEKANQTITFDPLPTDLNQASPDFTTTVSASSGLPVSLSSDDESIASTSGLVVSIHTSGEVTLTASQVGNNNYHAAADVSRTLTIAEVLSALNDRGVNVYPNPAATHFTLEASNIRQVRLMNVQGQTVRTFSGGSSTFDLREVPSGLYLVWMETSQGTQKIARLKVTN